MPMNEGLHETMTQFLARMLIATREQHQISSRDAQRLSDLADGAFLDGRPQQTTMPEERRDPSALLPPHEVVG